jgi:hypothetical protein
MRTSQYKKAHRDVLFEWVWDDANSIAEPFKISKDIRDNSLSYIGSNLTLNDVDRQLFPIDKVQRKYGLIDETQYPFLNVTDHSSQGQVRHDQLKIYFPANFDFGEYRGVYVRVYTFDFELRKTHDLTNYYFDKLDSDQSDLAEFTPPLLYEGRLWDNSILINIPSVEAVALQLQSGSPTPGSINQLLTDGRGLSKTSPIFVDFHFITSQQTVGGVNTYTITEPYSYEFPQSPSLEELDMLIKESDEGDFFEIYPTYNGEASDYSDFIDQSYQIGKVYYNEFVITVFEQNRKGRSMTIVKEKDFTEPIEWRPVIRSSSSNVIIDVEMKLIDKVDGSIVTRKSYYGMLPDQISKYSFKPKKIKVRDLHKPKIYIKKNLESVGLDAITRKDPKKLVVKIDAPKLIDLDYIHASSENMENKRRPKKINNFYPLGELKIVIRPFDNLLKFTLANITDNKLDFIDLSNCQNIKFHIKTSDKEMTFDFTPQVNTNVVSGMCSFKISQNNYQDIKDMYDNGARMFYITTTNKGVRCIIYSGLFVPEDYVVVSKVSDDINLIPVIKPDIDNPNLDNTAVVTRRAITVNNQSNKVKSVVQSIKQVNKFKPVKFKLDPRIK